MKKKIVIIDYGMGNIRSVFNAFSYLGCTPNVSSSIKDIASADALILPGVGSFRVAMEHLTQNDMGDAIKDAVQVHQKQILGICLGFQLLSEESTEDGKTDGLNIMGGHITKFDVAKFSSWDSSCGIQYCQSDHESVLYRDLGDENEFFLSTLFAQYSLINLICRIVIMVNLLLLAMNAIMYLRLSFILKKAKQMA